MSFGEKLTKLRKERGMSQEDLANNLNVSRQAVSKWESNNSYPETDKIIAICKLFNSSMDELIGLKEGKIKKENRILRTINTYFDEFIEGIKMFYAMTFRQKIKCMVEMVFYFLVLVVIFIIARTILIEIIRKLLYILPHELLMIFIQIFDGLINLVYVIFTMYALVKLYKVRFLDYYKSYINEKIDNKEVVNVAKNDSKNNKLWEEKIIIRDQDNLFNPFLWIKKSIVIFIKLLALLINICLVIAFVLLIALIMFTSYFIKIGLIIFYIIILLLGCLLVVYIFIEVFIKFIFNMKQNPKRLFVMFILAMIIVGLSMGLFGCELTTYKIIDKPEYNTLIYKKELEMQDNLLIKSINDYNTEIIFVERDNILIELYGTELNISSIESYYEKVRCNSSYDENLTYVNFIYYNFADYFNELTINEFLGYILNGVKNKTIVNAEALVHIKAKIYISKDNFKIVNNNLKNIDNCQNYIKY